MDKSLTEFWKGCKGKKSDHARIDVSISDDARGEPRGHMKPVNCSFSKRGSRAQGTYSRLQVVFGV
jgi:hypothetical protein